MTDIGRELSTLDFANLIGGPMNAMVEAQAKSAIATANFIREVGFDKDGNVINVEFKYERANDAGEQQEFSLTVPFLTMLPIPYVALESGTIEFNARISSVQEANMESVLDSTTEVEASAKAWFVSARVNSKTAYQKKSATTDKEERTYDMRIMVQVKSQDMPSGTERLMTLLENVIMEAPKGTTLGGPSRSAPSLPNVKTGTATVTEMVMEGDVSKMTPGSKVSIGGIDYTVAGIDPVHNKLLLSLKGR